VETPPRLLLNNILYYEGGLGKGKLKKGFIFVSNGRVADIGEIARVEYELSEYVYDYKGAAVAHHGYALILSPSLEPFKALGSGGTELLGILSRAELERIVLNSLQKMLSFGVTLPIIDDPYPEIVANIAIRHDLKVVIMDKGGTVKKFPRVPYLLVKNDRIYFRDRQIGLIKDICQVHNGVSGRGCLFIDVRNSPMNPQCIFVMLKNIDPLFKPYKVLGYDEGYIGKNSLADIVIYQLDDPFRNYLPPSELTRFLQLGLKPSTVISNGDVLIEKDMPVGFEPQDITGLLLRHIHF
jgi:hypothetical protein